MASDHVRHTKAGNTIRSVHRVLPRLTAPAERSMTTSTCMPRTFGLMFHTSTSKFKFRSTSSTRSPNPQGFPRRHERWVQTGIIGDLLIPHRAPGSGSNTPQLMTHNEVSPCVCGGSDDSITSTTPCSAHGNSWRRRRPRDTGKTTMALAPSRRSEGVSRKTGGPGMAVLRCIGGLSGGGWRMGLLVGLLAASIRQVEAYPGDTDPWWVYVTMPFISGVVGYATNILALKMTFFPVEFWGIKIWQPEDQPLGCIGWQGIVPAKAAKMAHKSVTLMTEKLINIKEVFSRLDPDEMCEALEPGLLAVVSRVVTEMAAKHMPGTWHFLPESSRDDIVLKALEDVPIFMRAFMEEVKTNIDDVLDVHHMVVSNLVKNKALMNRVFMEVGAKELIFIERSGLLFGFIFGCMQTCLWYFYQEDWVLPVGGLVVGWLTNYLALNMIFKPVNERVVCGLKLQGLFLKRQTEVSAHFAELTANEILTSHAMWEAILTGPKRDSFNEMCTRHTHQFVDLMAGSLRPLVEHMIGEREFVELKDEIADQMIENLPVAIRFGHTYTTEALDMTTTIRTAMQGLSPPEFEGVLHPVFEEDEWKLILVGAALGAAVGVFQLFVLF